MVKSSVFSTQFAKVRLVADGGHPHPGITDVGIVPRRAPLIKRGPNTKDKSFIRVQIFLESHHQNLPKSFRFKTWMGILGHILKTNGNWRAQ